MFALLTTNRALTGDVGREDLFEQRISEDARRLLAQGEDMRVRDHGPLQKGRLAGPRLSEPGRKPSQVFVRRAQGTSSRAPIS